MESVAVLSALVREQSANKPPDAKSSVRFFFYGCGRTNDDSFHPQSASGPRIWTPQKYAGRSQMVQTLKPMPGANSEIQVLVDGIL
jgi:hypothetical protein